MTTPDSEPRRKGAKMLREKFEALYPVPEGVAWGGGYYGMSIIGLYNRAAKDYNRLWQGFLSGYAQAIEDQAAIVAQRNRELDEAKKELAFARGEILGMGYSIVELRAQLAEAMDAIKELNHG